MRHLGMGEHLERLVEFLNAIKLNKTFLSAKRNCAANQLVALDFTLRDTEGKCGEWWGSCEFYKFFHSKRMFREKSR